MIRPVSNKPFGTLSRAAGDYKHRRDLPFFSGAALSLTIFTSRRPSRQRRRGDGCKVGAAEPGGGGEFASAGTAPADAGMPRLACRAGEEMRVKRESPFPLRQ
jgi:hypothetical protein